MFILSFRIFRNRKSKPFRRSSKSVPIIRVAAPKTANGSMHNDLCDKATPREFHAIHRAKSSFQFSLGDIEVSPPPSTSRYCTDAEPTSPSPPVTVPPPCPSTASTPPTVTAGRTPLARLTTPIAPGKSACAANIPPSPAAGAPQPRLPSVGGGSSALPPPSPALPCNDRAVAVAVAAGGGGSVQ